VPTQVQQENYFTQIPDWVILAHISHAEFRVYAAICRRTDNKERTSYPGHRLIAKEARCSTATVGSAIEALEKIGAIIVTRDPKTRHTNLYYLPMLPYGGVAMADTGVAMTATGGVAMTATQLEPVLTTTKNKREPTTRSPAQQANDQIIEAFHEACGWEVEDITEATMRATAVAVSKLKPVTPTVAEVHERAAVYRQTLPWALTPAGLVKWWAKCAPVTTRPCPNRCGPDGYYFPNNNSPYPVACPNPGCEHKRKAKQ